MAYQVAFYGEVGGFILPVNPEKMPIKDGADATSFNILATGEAIRPGKRKLRDYEIDSHFPADNADAGVAFFRTILDNEKPVQMIYTRDGREPENVAVVVLDFNHEERGGEPGRIYYKLKLKEFRPIQARVV